PAIRREAEVAPAAEPERPAAAAAAAAAAEEVRAPAAEAPRAAESARPAEAPAAPRPRVEVLTPNLPGMRGPNVPVTETANLRPTATQAVVISRPLIPVRRVTPPTSQFRPAPA